MKGIAEKQYLIFYNFFYKNPLTFYLTYAIIMTVENTGKRSTQQERRQKR